MVDGYCREIKSIKDNIESSLKISGIIQFKKMQIQAMFHLIKQK